MIDILNGVNYHNILRNIKMSNTWITTYSGKQFYPLDPNPDDITIDDIAHALSNLCRWNGHVKSFYSVAQHSVIVSQHCKPEHMLYGLLHDSSEGLSLGDFPTPIKRLPQFDYYRKVEHNLQSMVYKKFGLEPHEPNDVKEADLIALATEMRDLMNPIAFNWHVEQKPLENKIEPLLPRQAKDLFLKRFYELTEQNARKEII